MPRKRAPEVRERILDAGIELLARHGLAGVNSNLIARAAGVGVGTFYGHFRDKHALLHAAVLRGLDAFARRAGRPARWEQARPLVEAAVGFAAEEPALFRVAFGPDAERVGLGASARGLERALRALQERGELDPRADPAVAARAFLAAQAGVLRWWLAAPAPPPRDAIVETLLRLHPAVALSG